jgi:uncharacterized protein YbbC (DUF1343 family)
MRIGFLIEITHCYYTEKITYETIDKFIEFYDGIESIERQIMKKYPTLHLIQHCDDNIVYDNYNNKKYLIVSQMI